MASLIDRNGTHYAQFYDSRRAPKKKVFSLRTKNKQIARRHLADFEERYEKRTFDPWNDDPFPAPEDRSELAGRTTGEVGQAFIAEKEAAGLSDNTLRTYNEIVSLFTAHVGASKPFARVSAADVNSFIRASGLAPATRRKRFVNFRVLVRWALKRDAITKDPLDNVTPPEKPKKIPKAITEEELEAVCAAIAKDYKLKRRDGTVRKGDKVWRIPLFRFMFYTGLRPSEAARLRWKHLDFDRRLIYIFEQKNKTENTIPLNSKAREVIEEVERGKPEHFVFLSPRTNPNERAVRNFVEKASEAFRDALKLAEVERPLSLYSTRHGFATALAEAGKSAFVIKEAARHADISTSAIYVSIANEALKEEIEDAFA